MTALPRDLRRTLEKTVRKARAAAEAGAAKALESLAVGRPRAWDRMTGADRALRNRLRAHGRQLGDRRDPRSGEQETARLVRECAYEHWHRMLFARFLAEAGLLIEPETGIPVTLDEARELARAAGDRPHDWLDLAGAWAGRMLPQIFRAGDPALDVALPPETRAELEALLEGLPPAAFLADDALGWVYQFWQADRKEAVNRSGVKIGADELPAVTQLFTEDYMVLFLLHNTLGAWWAGKVLATRPGLAASAKDEGELREACKAGGVEWTYLRFVRADGEDGASGPWRPAAGAYHGWPSAAKDLTLCDPCMGSGHFLVFALPILAALRMAEEGLAPAEATDAVLRDNLFGLEIDPRCTQIAAFNLAFAAWRRAGYRRLPALNLACSGLAVGAPKADWLRLAGKAAAAADPGAARDLLGTERTLLTAGVEERVKNGLAALHELFAQAPALGSLIDPRRVGGDILTAGFEALESLLGEVLAAAENDTETAEMAVAARGMAKAAELLGRRFTLVATNVPFLGRGKQGQALQGHLAARFDDAKRDLATAMLRRCLGFADAGGTVAAVTPQNWLFLNAYARLRERVLRETKLDAIAALGPRAFETISGEIVNTALVTLSAAKPPSDAAFAGLDANDGANTAEKARALTEGALSLPAQKAQNANPDRRISVGEGVSGPLLRKYAMAYQGIATGDFPKFGRLFWEMNSLNEEWSPQISTVDKTMDFGGMQNVLHWENGEGELSESPRARVQGLKALGRPGICVSQMRELPVARFPGTLFDNNCSALVPHDPADLPAVWAFCSSPEYNEAVRKIDRSLNVTNATLVKVPFDVDHWRQVAAQRYPGGLPKPRSDDPTQWLFDGHPARGSRQFPPVPASSRLFPNLEAGPGAAPLQVAVARLCGYRWPRQTGSGFMDCPPVDPDGLEPHADADGIVCLAALAGEAPAHERLAALLADAFAPGWSAATLARLLAEAGFPGRSLDDWLRDGFFAQHCKLFHHRPFVWHVWDGRRDGFHALVNYHRLAGPDGEGRRTLEKLAWTCLGAWIDRQRAERDAGAEGADARLAHAEHLRAELVKILEGAPPCDLFARWKPLHEQPLGWEPDVDDGVRVNVRPFMAARPLAARAKDACILRATPKIHWRKDRGKEPAREKAGYPWFWSRDPDAPAHRVDFPGGADFDGNRWNDLHYTRAAREAARTRAAEGEDR